MYWGPRGLMGMLWRALSTTLVAGQYGVKCKEARDRGSLRRAFAKVTVT